MQALAHSELEDRERRRDVVLDLLVVEELCHSLARVEVDLLARLARALLAAEEAPQICRVDMRSRGGHRASRTYLFGSCNPEV